MNTIGEYLPKYDLYINYTTLPDAVRGCITTVRGEPVAVINVELNDSEKIRAIWHEILHLLRGDLNREDDIRELERM